MHSDIPHDGFKITDPLIELLAIKLFEHDHPEWPIKHKTPSWRDIDNDDREIYRRIARGEDQFYPGTHK